MPRPFLMAAAVACLTLACADGPLRQARARDTAPGWRAYLATDPDPRDAEAAQDRLRELVHEEALRAHTLVGYKRFLDEFPASPEAPGIRARLAGLRFFAAEEQGTAAGWRIFLAAHPEAPQRAEAEARLAALVAAEGAATPASPAGGRTPGGEGGLLSEEADAALFRAAGTSRELLAYLDEQPAGRHRDEARAALLAREVEGLLVSGALAQARETLARSPLSRRLPELPARVTRMEQEQALLGRPDPLLRAAQPAFTLRPIPELEEVLRAPDPMDRWQAAEELGHHASVAAIGPLLGALEPAQHPLVRQRALDALMRVFAALPEPVTEHEVATRVARLAPNAASPDRSLMLALLLDAGGRLAEATLEYQRAYDARVAEPMILRRWMEIRRDRGEWYSAAVSARQLALWSLELARAEDAAASDGVPPLAPARRLCAAFELAGRADAVIREAAGKAEDFAADLEAFAKVSSEALALSRARLGDAELRLREELPGARPCGDDGVSRRLAEAEGKRLSSLERLVRERPTLRGALLARALHDPAPAVRARARQLAAHAADAP